MEVAARANLVSRSGLGMPSWFLDVLGVFLLGLLALGVILYVRYHRSPQARWRNLVLVALAVAYERLRQERDTLYRLTHHEAEEEALRDKAFHSFLNTIPVNDLEAYPGIGPATISRLREAHRTTLASLHGAPITVEGLGPKRTADVSQAVADLTAQARSRFDAGACRQAQDLTRRLDAMRAARGEEEFRAQARVRAAEAVQQQLEPLAQLARHIHFLTYLLGGPDPTVRAAVLSATLPDLEPTILAADEQARRTFTKQRPAPAPPETAPPARTPAGRVAAAPAVAARVPSGDLFQQALQAPAPPRPTAAEANVLVLLELTVQFAFAVARADGRVARKEKDVIEQYLQRHWGTDQALLNRAKAFSAHYETAALDLESCLKQLGQLVPIEGRHELLDFAIAIADAAGERNQREAEFLERVSRQLGVPVAAPPTAPSPATAPSHEAPAPPAATPEAWRAVLEIDPATPLSADLVRRQWHLLSERYTPDKFQAMGPDFVTMAQGKRTAILAAATALLEQWGEKLELAVPAESQELRHNPDLDAMFGMQGPVNSASQGVSMSIYEEIALTDLDKKAREVFGDHVVVKSLAQQAAFHGLPRYVSEYLIAKYVHPETWQDDLAKVQTRIKDLLPDLDHRELSKNQLLRTGELTLIDSVEARVDLRSGQRWARVPAINDDKVRVSAAIMEQNPGLLLGGLWGTTKIKYSPEADSDFPSEVAAFTPFQVGPPDLAGYRAARPKFTTDEWIGLMLQSAGYAPQAFASRRLRLLLLSRLIPLVERNVNLIELGPRQTGKTFLLRNVSPRVFTISGGKTTPANLFVNLATRAVGILGTRKVVVFDEIAHTTFGDEDATISTLKDYMESGQFSRGAKSFAADASLSFAGNLDVEGDRPDPRYRHLFEPLPKELIDSAFLDRIHAYLPGWEVPKITPTALAQGVGFVTDYFGEVLVKLREDDFQDRARALGFTVGMTRRDQVAVERITSGLIKLIFPDGKLTEDELREVVSLACEYRQRVHNQLSEIAPGEFKPRMIGWEHLTEHVAADLHAPSRDVLPQDDHLNREAIVGAVTGLSVIEKDGVGVGGDLILIQVSAFAGKGHVEVTGLHGPVLRDSVQTAYNIVRSRFHELGINEKRLREQVVAVHLVRIAEPKEGPSAGIAFVVGIVSALTGRPVKPACAMTGEVTLHGEITGVGGLPFKIRAAAKAGRKLVLVPAENARDVGQVPDNILSQVEVVPVKTIQEVLDKVLEATPAPV